MKSESEKYHLEKWCRWTYQQSRNRDSDREQMSGHQGGKEGGKNWETETDICARLWINQIMRTYHIAPCFWTVVLDETLESPLDCKIKPVNPKGNQPWLFIGRTDAEAEVPILWSPDAKSWLTEKYPDAGKDWRQEENGTTEDEMVGWHHWFNGHDFEQTLGNSEGQGTLVYSVHGVPKSQTQLSNWATTTKFTVLYNYHYSFENCSTNPKRYYVPIK